MLSACKSSSILAIIPYTPTSRRKICYNNVMPQTDAYQFLRAQLAGTANRPATYIPPVFDGDVDPGAREQQVPPILVVPDGMDKYEFVAQVERAHGLDFSGEEFMQPAASEEEQKKKDEEHAVAIMADGLVSMGEEDLARASDMFSLCIIISPNYLYRFLLGVTRYYLFDMDSALLEFNEVVESVRREDVLPAQVMPVYYEIMFADDLYSLLIKALLHTNKLQQARQMADFVVKQSVFADAETYLTTAWMFMVYDDKTTAAKLVEKVLPSLQEMDEQTRALAMDSVQRILNGDGIGQSNSGSEGATSVSSDVPKYEVGANT